MPHVALQLTLRYALQYYAIDQHWPFFASKQEIGQENMPLRLLYFIFVDIDECAANKATCAYNEDCVNTEGGFKCVCGWRCRSETGPDPYGTFCLYVLQ